MSDEGIVTRASPTAAEKKTSAQKEPKVQPHAGVLHPPGEGDVEEVSLNSRTAGRGDGDFDSATTEDYAKLQLQRGKEPMTTRQALTAASIGADACYLLWNTTKFVLTLDPESAISIVQSTAGLLEATIKGPAKNKIHQPDKAVLCEMLQALKELGCSGDIEQINELYVLPMLQHPEKFKNDPEALVRIRDKINAQIPALRNIDKDAPELAGLLIDWEQALEATNTQLRQFQKSLACNTIKATFSIMGSAIILVSAAAAPVCAPVAIASTASSTKQVIQTTLAWKRFIMSLTHTADPKGKETEIDMSIDLKDLKRIMAQFEKSTTETKPAKLPPRVGEKPADVEMQTYEVEFGV